MSLVVDCAFIFRGVSERKKEVRARKERLIDLPAVTARAMHLSRGRDARKARVAWIRRIRRRTWIRTTEGGKVSMKRRKRKGHQRSRQTFTKAS